MLKNDAMGGMAQGLRMGHIESWRVNHTSGKAGRNRLKNYNYVTQIWRAHQVILATYCNMSIKARPITVAICVLSRRNILVRSGETCKFYVTFLLHSILVQGMHLGLRYDETSKVKVE